jgi:hypothetical protein
MIFAIAVLVVAGGVLMLRPPRVGARVDLADRGSMSAQWLAEHRASHLS